MKTINPSLKIIKNQLKNLTVFISLCILVNSGCKISYDDISFGQYTESYENIGDFARDDYGYILYDVDEEKIVKGHNINKDFTPASVTKLFTSLFSIETLGDDYTFSTTLSYDGDISDNILTGNIYLKGSGDPELSIDGLQSLVSGLKSKKIKELKGNFYFDESDFAPRELLDKDMPADAYYNAGISPLSFNSNIIFALQVKSSEGKIISAEMLPSLPAFGSYIYTEKLPYPFLKFKLSEGKEIWGLPNKYLWDSRQPLPVKHPGLFTAQTFHKLCEINGIKLPLPKSGKTAPSAKIISEFKSKPLTSIIKNMLVTSNNMTAELIYTISSAAYGKKANLNIKETNAMKDFFTNSFTGLKWNNFLIANASGLTNLNKATPAQTAAVLIFINKINKESFRLEDILPLSGWDGTMKGRMDQPEGALRVYAKTGSIFYASGLAGIFNARSGKKYIFTIYINDNAKRLAYDVKRDKTADDLNSGGFWSKKASLSIDKFILKMIKEL